MKCIIVSERFIKATVCMCVCLYSSVSCPYSEMNLNKEGLLPDRLSGERPLTVSGPHPRGRRPDPHTNTTTQSSSTPEHPEGAEDSQNRSVAETCSRPNSCENQHQHSEEDIYQCFTCNSIKWSVLNSELSVLLGNQQQWKLSV